MLLDLPLVYTVEGWGWGLGECVLAPAILTDPQVIANALRNNERFASLLGWGTLRDQIEVNILGCPRANRRLAPADFVQAVALFQRNQRLRVEGSLGPDTWLRMKAMQVEREPFPRHRLVGDFDATAPPGNLHCEASNSPRHRCRCAPWDTDPRTV